MNITEEGAKVANTAIDAMKSTPLAIALLVVNIGFLSFAAYVLGQVAANASERNKTQTDLIANLVRDIRDCRQPEDRRGELVPLPLPPPRPMVQ